ncbi:acyltransferase family protein [Thalassotalea atypica]|uniref:acyltransferase family protein n=1 Tax=Thalassotalea atypica TaxID=2054316 RepID=UPI0025741DBC|nr:acyltransferase [Thalassotalea atypica]
MTNSPSYLHHLHAFRGFAILNVVGAHAWSFMIFWTGDLSSEGISRLFWLTETIFHGSTVYFALISGLLFSKILETRGWQAFFTSKFTNVVIPYIIISLFLTWHYWQYLVQDPVLNISLKDYLIVVWSNLISGKASIHFWYIPVLMVMFLVTPLLAWIQKHSIIAMNLIALLPLVISRSPFPDFLKPQTFIFFIGAYVLGMVVGQHYEQFKLFVAKYQRWLLVLVLLTSFVLFSLYLYGYQAEGFYSVRQTLVYLQKTAICALALYWLSQREDKLPNWLLNLGSYAFAIFFLHVIFIDLVIQSSRDIVAASRTVELIALLGSLNFVAAIVGSMLIALIVKRIFARHARKIVGA